MVPSNGFARTFKSFVVGVSAVLGCATTGLSTGPFTVSFKFLVPPNGCACSFTTNAAGFSAGAAAAATFGFGAVLSLKIVSNGSEVPLSTESTVAKRLAGGGLADALPDELSRGLRGGVLSGTSSGVSLALAFLSCFRRNAAVTAPQTGGLLRVLVLPRAATRQFSLT